MIGHFDSYTALLFECVRYSTIKDLSLHIFSNVDTEAYIVQTAMSDTERWAAIVARDPAYDVSLKSIGLHDPTQPNSSKDSYKTAH